MRNPKNMLIVGIVLLVVGVCILLFNPDQSAANLEIARNAKNAQEAAAAISGNKPKGAYDPYGREFSCRDRHRADGRRFFPEKEETVIV